MAFLIAFEGIDGSGKGTQAKRLYEGLAAAGIRTQQTGFPRYSATFFGRAVGAFLNGEYGELQHVDPFLAAMLYAGDRYESKTHLAELAETADVIVLDRWMASNLAHQAARRTGAERETLLSQIRHLECTLYGLPEADLTILLDLPAEQARELVQQKAARDYTSRTHDLQEADLAYQQTVRQVYRDLASASNSWRTISCLAGDELRPVDDIAREILSAVQQVLANCTG
ncbi:MAG: thymidylate kinase [Planctomycetaceae bacterium]|nr:thymidylate kinase [Planctomycetaceae bacterium]